MIQKAPRVLALIGLLAILATAHSQAAEPNAAPKQTLIVRFHTYPDGFLDAIGLADQKDPKHGFYVLNDIEAFFVLSDRSKDAARPKPQHVQSGKRMHFVPESGSQFAVSVCPLASADEKIVQLSIQTPSESLFVLDGVVNLQLKNGQAVYLPSHRQSKESEQLYCVLTLQVTKSESCSNDRPIRCRSSCRDWLDTNRRCVASPLQRRLRATILRDRGPLRCWPRWLTHRPDGPAGD